MRLLQLLTDPATGRLSESKLWLHPTKAVLIWAFVYVTLHYPPSEWLWVAFGGLMLSHETVSRMVSWRYGKPEAKAEAGAQ